jgi:hypothetical protein
MFFDISKVIFDTDKFNISLIHLLFVDLLLTTVASCEVLM